VTGTAFLKGQRIKRFPDYYSYLVVFNNLKKLARKIHRRNEDLILSGPHLSQFGWWRQILNLHLTITHFTKALVRSETFWAAIVEYIEFPFKICFQGLTVFVLVFIIEINCRLKKLMTIFHC